MSNTLRLFIKLFVSIFQKLFQRSLFVLTFSSLFSVVNASETSSPKFVSASAHLIDLNNNFNLAGGYTRAIQNTQTGYPAPTIQSLHLSFNTVTYSSAKFNWTNGNGTSRAVFVAQTSLGIPAVANNTHYNASAVFGSGSQAATAGWYCVYNGADSSASVTGLTAGTTYRVMVLEYNGTPGNESYLPASGGSPANVTTVQLVPTQQAIHLSFANTTGYTTNLSWQSGNGASRAVFVARAEHGIPVVTDNVKYYANTVFGAGTQIGASGWYCVYNNSGSSAVISGLQTNTTYRVVVVEYDNIAGALHYLTTSGSSPANVTTLLAPPLVQASRLTFTNTTTSGTTANWTNGSGASRVVFAAKTNFGVPVITQNTTYIPSSKFGLGTPAGNSGWYCVYNGTGSTVSVDSLLDNTTYRFSIIEYNGGPGNEKYLSTSGSSPGNVTTLPAPALTDFSPAGGPVGTLITVNGRVLSNATALTIGGTNAIIVSNNGSKIVGLVMPGTAGGAITLTVNGKILNVSNTFSVSAPLYPTGQQGKKIVDSSQLIDNAQGHAVALSADGNTAIVGAPQFAGTGAVLFYARVNGVWKFQGDSQQLLQNEPSGNGDGSAVAISADGNIAVEAGSGSNAAGFKVHTFSRVNGSWMLNDGTAVLPVGQVLALSADGNTLAVGYDQTYTTPHAAKTAIYIRKNNSWIRQSPVLPVNADASAISADGNTVIFGQSAYSRGAGGLFFAPYAVIYHRKDSTWTKQSGSLRSSGNYVAINADGTTAVADGSDEALIYTLTGNTWTMQGSPLPDSNGPVAISADGNTIIDSYGDGAAIYTRTGSTWTQQKELTAGLGTSVAISADASTALVGDETDNNGIGGVWSFIYVPAPATQAIHLIFSGTTSNSTTINWTNGSGSARAVFLAQTSIGIPGNLTDNNTYTASTAFGSGTQSTSGWYCVYNGTGSAVTVTGLSPGTTYRAIVVEYNGDPGNEKYLHTNGSSPANVTTKQMTPAVQASAIEFTNITHTATTANWTNGDGQMRAVFLAKTNGGTPVVVNQTTYNASPAFSFGSQSSTGWYCVYNGSGSSVNITGLVGGTTYRMAIVEYDGAAGNQMYLTPGLPGVANFSTTGAVNSMNALTKISFLANRDSSAKPIVVANNILSPNGDGVNDTWLVKNIELYENNIVTVYNQAGNIVFNKKNYTNDWNGTYRGAVLTEGSYYYTIDLGNSSILKGFITVVRDR